MAGMSTRSPPICLSRRSPCENANKPSLLHPSISDQLGQRITGPGWSIGAALTIPSWLRFDRRIAPRTLRIVDDDQAGELVVSADQVQPEPGAFHPQRAGVLARSQRIGSDSRPGAWGRRCAARPIVLSMSSRPNSSSSISRSSVAAMLRVLAVVRHRLVEALRDHRQPLGGVDDAGRSAPGPAARSRPRTAVRAGGPGERAQGQRAPGAQPAADDPGRTRVRAGSGRAAAASRAGGLAGGEGVGELAFEQVQGQCVGGECATASEPPILPRRCRCQPAGTGAIP